MASASLTRSPFATTLLATSLLAASLSGCIPARRVGHFGSNGFYHARDHYRVRYLDQDERTVLPARWTLENFEMSEGEPTEARMQPETAYLDSYAMSQFAPVRREYPFTAERVDLRYRSDDGVGEIYARTLPLPPGWARAGLGTVMRRAIVSLTTPLAQAPDLLGHQVPAGTVVHLRSEGPARVDGREAYYVTFDLIQADRSTGQERVRRCSVVGVRPDEFAFRVRRWRLPMMVVFGHISAPDEHLTQRPEFESFVRRVDFADPGA